MAPLIAQMLFTLGMYALGCVIFGLAAFPGAWMAIALWRKTAALAFAPRLLSVCIAGAGAFFLFGFALMAIVTLLRVVLRLDLREGEYPMFSAGAAKWVVSNALQFIVWSTFGDYILLTPFAALFYRLMGAKVGRNVQINSKFCADLSLLEIGDGSVIGGHASVIGHSFERTGLILKKVRIGRHAVIGLNAVLLPGVEIGDKAVVAAGAIVPKHTHVAAGAVYLGSGLREAHSLTESNTGGRL